MSNNWKDKLGKKVKDHLKGYSGCHDYYHAERTLKYALAISKKIQADRDIVYAGALLHDVGYQNNAKDEGDHYKLGIKIAQKWLPEIGFPKDKIEEVLDVIRLHDNFSWGHNYEPTEKNEIKIIQDADRIDALGAVGIARFAMYFGEKRYPLYDPTPPPKTKVVWLNHDLADQLRRDGIKKYENLNFEYSKKISKKQYFYLKNFYKTLKKELEEAHLK